MIEETRQLDARGLRCPLPILKTKKVLAEMQPGEKLLVFATDPGSIADFSTFASNTGHLLLESGKQGDEYVFLVQKRA